MPFGYPKLDEEVEAAVEIARRQGSICLAAAANSGANAPVSFPARHRGVIAINSTDGYGNPSAFNPSPRDNDRNFSTLGEGVPTAPMYRTEGIESRKSGTSFSVCIAAGILARMLEYTNAKMKLSGSERNKLHSYEGALAMLTLMSTKRAGYSYVAPWLLWTDENSMAIVNDKILQAIRAL
jgi:hypothetical protein